MLTIHIPEREIWDENKEMFLYTNSVVLKLEHSLVSISKWESKFNVPFLSEGHTNAEILEYIKCMSIGSEIQNGVLECLTEENFSEISKYIDSPMTATLFSEQPSTGRKSVITSELIYYWMIAYNIPFECQKWHLNRLLTLIRICSIKEEQRNGKHKMKRSEINSMYQSLNTQRRAKLNSKG